jgi:hypothetical protein
LPPLLEQNGKVVIHFPGVLAMLVSRLSKALVQLWTIRVPGDPSQTFQFRAPRVTLRDRQLVRRNISSGIDNSSEKKLDRIYTEYISLRIDSTLVG